MQKPILLQISLFLIFQKNEINPGKLIKDAEGKSITKVRNFV